MLRGELGTDIDVPVVTRVNSKSPMDKAEPAIGV